MQVFAGPESVPVIAQARTIFARLGVPFFDSNAPEELPENAIALAACNADARFPSRFLRNLPADPERRLREISERRIELPESALQIPRLVLVRQSRTPDGRYGERELKGFTAALENLAGITPPKGPSSGVPRRTGRDSYASYLCGTP